TAEMAGRGGMGVTIDLDKVPQRARNMSAYEIMLSESQERMLGVCTPEQLPLVKKILAKWDLETHVLGELNNSGLMTVIHKGQVVAQIPATKISEDSPIYHRQGVKPAYLEELPRADDMQLPPLEMLPSVIMDFLASPNVSSKGWIFEQYDYMVQTQTLIPPGNDAAVLKVHGSGKALAVSTDGNPLFCYLDPYEGGKHAVAEAARNVACTGARPLAITNCLNFGSPLKPEIFYQLAEAIRGIGDACRALNTPVTGGNVSLYNESPEGAICPTPVIGMIGAIDSPVRPMKGFFPHDECSILLVGPVSEHLGGSEFLRWRTGKACKPCPPCDLGLEKQMVDFLVHLASTNLGASAHDCSIGGLLVSLVECLVWSETDWLGAQIAIDASDVRTCYAELFGEFAPRVVVAVPIASAQHVFDLALRYNLPVRQLGRTSRGGDLVIETCNQTISIATRDLRCAYESTASIFPDASEQVARH
ncbi:MAG: AIR synthase related protein, partial [Candidatus Sumerlaeaceae bacterium]|nr:AIR synthase related protein [Candidatus Sumerlaeaceae bacterium]